MTIFDDTWYIRSSSEKTTNKLEEGEKTKPRENIAVGQSFSGKYQSSQNTETFEVSSEANILLTSSETFSVQSS